MGVKTTGNVKDVRILVTNKTPCVLNVCLQRMNIDTTESSESEEEKEDETFKHEQEI